MVLKTKWTNLNRFQCFGSFLQRPKKVSEAVVARSFAILPRSAISGMARQRFSQKIAYHWSTQRLFCICAILLTYKNSALVVGKVENRKFNQQFCSNNWFFIDQKGRCARVISSAVHVLPVVNKISSQSFIFKQHVNWEGAQKQGFNFQSTTKNFFC